MESQIDEIFNTALVSFINTVSDKYNLDSKELEKIWNYKGIKKPKKTKKNIRLGLCCINTELRNQKIPVYTSIHK
jgi:hypothetical protein